MNDTSDPLSDVPLSVVAAILESMRYISVLSPVVVIYDYFLTLDDEVCLMFSSFATSPILPFAPRSSSFGQGPLPCPRQCITLIAT